MKTKIFVTLTVLLVVFFLGSKMVEKVDENGNIITPIPTESAVTSEVVIEDLEIGTGEIAEVGNTVKMNYTGTFSDGSVFDSNQDKENPFSFVLGKGEVIAGWDQGIPGMLVGGKRKLTVPPELGYGENDYASIPANSTLIFEVELLEVIK